MPRKPEERRASLVAYLSHAGQPKSLAEIAAVFPEYGDDEAGRRMFIRDKAELLAAGLPVREAGDRYSLERDRMHLDNLDLDDAERAALHVALRAIPLLQGAAGPVSALLGGVGMSGPALPFSADLESLEPLPVLHGAARERVVVTFSYRGRVRSVEPFGLVFRHGVWYLHGREQADGERKNFRVERIDGPVTTVGSERDGFERPDDVDLTTALTESWELPGDEPVEARVRVSAALASKVLDDLGPSIASTREPDGSVVVTMRVTHRGAFRNWLLSLLDHAVVLEPVSLRADVVAWLTSVVEGEPA